MAQYTGMVHTTDMTSGTAGAVNQNIQIKEDFSDVIYNLTPTETPVLSLCKRSSTKNTEVGWFLDKLTDNKNYVIGGADEPFEEGADMDSDVFEQVKRTMNLTQIFHKSVQTSGTAEAVDFYGRASEMAYQMTKKAQELKRDIETTICSALHPMSGGYHSCMVEDTHLLTNTKDGVRQFANLKQQINDNPFGTARTVYDNGLNTTLAESVFSEEDMNKAMEQMWVNGGEPNILVCTGSFANHIAKFATSASGLSGRYRESGQGTKLVNVVDVYVTPFGELRVVLDRFINVGEVDTSGVAIAAEAGFYTKLNDAFLIDAEYIECCYLREPKVEEIAKTGDSDKKLLVSELTFKVLAPDGVGLIEKPLLAKTTTDLS